MSIALHTPIGWLKISGEDGFVTEIKYIADGTECDNISSPVIEQAREQLCQYFDYAGVLFERHTGMAGTLRHKNDSKYLCAPGCCEKEQTGRDADILAQFSKW